MEGFLRDRIIILHEKFHGLAQKDRVFLFDTYSDNQTDELGVHFVFVLKLTKMCYYLLKVFLLGL